MQRPASSYPSRPSYTAHLRALYRDADDASDAQHEALKHHNVPNSSLLGTSKDDSEQSAQSLIGSAQSIDCDAAYYALLSHLTNSPKAPHNHSSTPPSPPTPATSATLPTPLWPIVCSIFECAARLHRLCHSPSARSQGSFSFLNLLTAHTDVTASLSLPSSSTSLLFSFLVALHRLSLQLGRERVDWWLLLQAAWVRQCRTDEQLRSDESVRQRLEDKRRIEKAIADVDGEEKEYDRPLVSAHNWQPLYSAEEAAPVGRKRKYSPLSTAATELLRLHYHAWRTHVAEQRTPAQLVTQAQLFLTHSVWWRWRDALLLHRADIQRRRADEQMLDRALHAWTEWWRRRELLKAAVRLARRHHQLSTQSLYHSRWMAALQEARDERRQLQTAARHHRQHYLPGAVQRWRRLAAIKQVLRSNELKGGEWRRRQLAVETLSVWRAALRGAVQYQKDAATSLRPLRLRFAVRQWQRTAKLARAVVVTSGPSLHAAFRWLHHSFSLPLPFAAIQSPSPILAIRPSRQAAHAAMLQLWRRWQLQRLHAAWRGVVAQRKVELVKLSHCQRLRSRQLLETAWQTWREEGQRKQRRRRRALSEAISRWRQHARQQKARREQLHTAALVDKFSTQRSAFELWGQCWRQCVRHRQERDRQSAAEQQREEHEALVDRQLQQHADTFHHSRLVSLCLAVWHSRTVDSLVRSCTLSLAASHHSSVCKQRTVQQWCKWQQRRKQRKAEVQSLVDRADVMYVGRLLSVMLVCWRVQLARRQSLRAMAERREQRELHERWQRWRVYVQLCQQQRRQQRDEEERQRREDNHRKGQLIVRQRLQSAWTVWRSRMAVVSVGQQLAEQRRLHGLQRAMSGWWEALRQKRRLAAARRSKLQQLLGGYVMHRQHAQQQRMRAELLLCRRAERGRLTAIFAVWKEGGRRRLQDRKQVEARDGHQLVGRALQQWRTAAQQGRTQLDAAAAALERGAGAALLAAAFAHWQHTLYLRSLCERMQGHDADGDTEAQLASFVHWRLRCMRDVWQVWRNGSIDRRLSRQAVSQHRSIKIGTALSHWRTTTRQAKQRRQMHTLSRSNSQRAVFAQWRHSLSLQRQERRAAESLRSTLTTASLSFTRPLLLSILHPQLPSQPVSDWFRRWRVYVAHRQQRLQLTTAAYQLYHHNLLAAAVAVLCAESRIAAQTASLARLLAQRRQSAALHDWHAHTQQRSTMRTVTELSAAHHSSRLVSGVLSAWRRQSKRGAARRLRCAEVERGVDALVVRSAFQRWHTAAVGERRRQRMFALSHAFLVWKWQMLRLRERRQLLRADELSTVAAQTHVIAVRV